MLAITIKINNHIWYYTGEHMVMCESMAKRVYSQRMASELLIEAKHVSLKQFGCSDVTISSIGEKVEERKGTFLTE